MNFIVIEFFYLDIQVIKLIHTKTKFKLLNLMWANLIHQK